MNLSKIPGSQNSSIKMSYLVKRKTAVIFCSGFDGRKDQTKAIQGVVQEEHYTIIKEPGDAYVNDVTPDDSAGSITEE